MIQISAGETFDTWRAAARSLLARHVSPDEVIWSPNEQRTLFGGAPPSERAPTTTAVPAEFVRMARTVACFDDPERWGVLYRILFRLIHEERKLLLIESDPDIRKARLMEKAVKRDIHKFHAFVRFRRIGCEADEIYAAWHEPHHLTVEMSAPFFVRRFGSMKFSILTPKGCAHWDRQALTFSPAADRSMAPGKDEMEEFWLLYYRSIFNPFRLKVSAMKREFPVRHWSTLPEAVLIPDLIRQANEVD